MASTPLGPDSTRVVFISGPSGSGKSTTARLVAGRMPGLCALLDFDQVRLLVKAGYAEPANGWNEDAERQWAIAKTVVRAMASTYCCQGVNVVVEAFATPHDYSFWRELVPGAPFNAFVLLPPVEVALKRNAQRRGAAKLQDGDIRQNHEWSTGWYEVDNVTVLNNATISPEEVAAHILAAVT